ncbi:transporter substrate-binding domain-containing protein [Aquamicrobium sp. LC103]|uniref:transporter substrate-binding domain-containing protein n=1 Tax=Aquamicrobium sp. LC103 TaxID=1120658 RepID=UPI000699C3D0|nr:transporter substrate-binding domain-containing protein [Aquamicrobium sp. LC103]
MVGLTAATWSIAEESAQEYLASNTLNVGIYNQAPWGFKDANGEVRGFDVDVIRAVLESTENKGIEFSVTQFPALIPGLQASRFDVATGGLYITPARCELVEFTNPTLKVPDAAIVLKGNPKNIHSFADIAAKEDVIFAATRGSITAKHADMAGVPKERQVLFQDNASTLAALLGGRVDVGVSSAGAAIAILSDPATGERLERAVPFEGVQDEQGNEVFGNVSLAFRADHAALRDFFDERIAEMKANGELLEIMKKYGFTETEMAADLSHQTLCQAE